MAPTNPDTKVTFDKPTAAGHALSQIMRRPKAADRDPAKDNRRTRTIELTLGTLFPIALLVLWQVASVHGWINRIDYPAPTDIVSEMRRTFKDNIKGNWWDDIGVSMSRLLWGYFWGSLFGIVFGVLMGMSRYVRATLEPTLNALYTVPKLALIGVFLLVFSLGNGPIIAVIAITVFFFVWIQTQEAVVAIGESYREAALSFGSNRWQMFRHVVLPASLPQIFVGLRIGGGVAVLTLIGAEFVYTPDSHGIGYRINLARTVYDPVQAYVGFVVAAVLGVLFTLVIGLVGRLVSPWVHQR
jgi:ABC-type nitrate/sulfonate/bicarbonate transport system permease component